MVYRGKYNKMQNLNDTSLVCGRAICISKLKFDMILFRLIRI